MEQKFELSPKLESRKGEEKRKKKRFTFAMRQEDRMKLTELTQHYEIKSDSETLAQLINSAYLSSKNQSTKD